MRTKSFALLILALGCGLVASIGITQVMAKRSNETTVISGETESIFVALQDVQMGDVLTAQVIRLEPWPKDKVPAGALTKFEDIDTRRTKTKLFAGEAILEDKLFRKGEDYTPTTMIPPGFRVVAVKTNMESSGGNLLNPGDRVDVMVYLTRCPQNEIHSTGTRTVLQNIKVFAVNDIIGMGGEKDGKTIKALTVSLLVTPEQAAKLALSSEMGTIRLSLRSPHDHEEHGIIDVTPRNLFGPPSSGKADDESLVETDRLENKSGGSLMDLLKAAADRASSTADTGPAPAIDLTPPASPTWNVRIIKPGEVEDVVLEGELSKAGNSSALWKSSTGATVSPIGPQAAIEPIVEPALKAGGDGEPVEPQELD
jgi:pilus assembly protein CpaB